MNVNKFAMKLESMKNILRNHSYISMNDNKAINIEYCREVLKLEDNLIELRLAKNTVSIVGLDLSMKNYAYDCVKIYGKIHSLTFDENEREDTDEEN